MKNYEFMLANIYQNAGGRFGNCDIEKVTEEEFQNTLLSCKQAKQEREQKGGMYSSYGLNVYPGVIITSYAHGHKGDDQYGDIFFTSKEHLIMALEEMFTVDGYKEVDKKEYMEEDEDFADCYKYVVTKFNNMD